jgi:beta-galactosidase
MKFLIAFLSVSLSFLSAYAQSEKNKVSDEVMQKIYNEIKTPYKYGLVMVPSDESRKMDCPTVFRKGDKWFMTYIIYDGRGYETWLAQSNDLLHWQNKGRIMSFSDTSDWDSNQKAGYNSLQDYEWGGSYQLNKYNGKYWMSYFGGNARGYEAGQLSIGMAYTGKNPSLVHEWSRLKAPVLSPADKDVRWWENRTMYKSSVIWDKSKTTGYPFVMYYNANGDSINPKKGAERIGMAVSDDMVHWKRFMRNPVLNHHKGITGDAYIQKIGNVWVMFYFGAFWGNTQGAFNRFACSYDLVNWTDWTGEDLIKPSEPYDETFAHKSFVVKYNGVVYHFYCAVNKADYRSIAVATSVDMGKSTLQFNEPLRKTESFNNGWKFMLGDDSLASRVNYDDSQWRRLNLPHDWSIEGQFSKDAPSKIDGGALPTGTGWYRKSFSIPSELKKKHLFIDFDGVYRNSEVWINGHYLGKRPYGYSSFRYELTPWLKFGDTNVISVKVDNSAQPNSRYYTGSGIYRNVWLVTVNSVYIDHWGTFVITPEINHDSASVKLNIKLKNEGKAARVIIKTIIYNAEGKEVANASSSPEISKDSVLNINQAFKVLKPELWSTDRPYLYRAVTTITQKSRILENYETPFGIRYFNFDAQKGFSLNGKPLKILGVCNHHDLGALGAAVNTRAIERQLEILKAMGCNAIRTAHNPPAPEFLGLCDRMGFLVMDEAFDMWKKKKNKSDYHAEWDEWHKKDLEDMVLRDRNHPSVFMWSIGNEIREQFDSTGISITRELSGIVKSLDPTRPVTSALTENNPEKNFIWKSGALDVLGFNYKQDAYADLPTRFPNQKFIATETMSVLSSRGHYDMPSDSIRLWPANSKQPYVEGNKDFTVSAYDHVMAYWGSTHEATWNIVKKLDFMAGMFIWSGFDFLGEPVPYPWPARSSYYGIIDLCGFPKDAYYLYQSEWTTQPVLHIFPHWNWEPDKMVDVWAYYNNADEVELFLNDKSLGIRKKQGDQMHIMWRVPFQPGTLKAVSRKNGQTVLTKEIKTAGNPARIELVVDRNTIKADSVDLSFVTVKITDKDGNLVPNADNLIHFKISGEGFIAGVDNGYQASMEPFKANYRKAFKGMCLVIIQSNGKPGKITLEASADALKAASLNINCK